MKDARPVAQKQQKKNLFTLPAFLCKKEGASLAGLQGAAVVNANPKGSTGRRVRENGPVSCGQEPSPTHHTGQTCLEKL